MVAAMLAACATQRSGLDSESHFACNSDADCATHGPRVACVAKRCVVPEGGTTDATPMETGGAVGMGGVPGSGGRAASGGSGGNSGMHVEQPDATLIPDTGPPTPVPDAAVCSQCTDSLPADVSLDCYCGAEPCDRTFAEALANPRWDRVDRGCGRLAVWRMPLGGSMESFDPTSGRLIGAEAFTDLVPSECVTPSGEDWAAGGRSYFEPYDTLCESEVSCTLPGRPDAGFPSAPVCDVDALLHPCPMGQVQAAVCTSCVTGCNGLELKCTLPCTSDQDCSASGSAGPNCVNGACALFCPF